MQERYPSSSLQQNADPSPTLTVSDDWVFGMTPNNGVAPLLPLAMLRYKQEHSTENMPQGTATHAIWDQSEAPHHSQPDLVTAQSTASAKAGEQEAFLGASLAAVSSSAQTADPDTTTAQVASPAAPSVAVCSSAQPADAVPASVKEAVDRFESWTLAQAAVVPLPSLADASATQPEPLLAHAQQDLHQAQAQQQTQHLQQQQQQQRLPTQDVVQQEQAVMPRHGSAASPSTEPRPVSPVSVSMDASTSSRLPGPAYHRHQEVLQPILSQPNQQASSRSAGSTVCTHVPASCLQPALALQQPQSSASTFIEATLAAINADQPVAIQEPRGPLSDAPGVTTSALSSKTESAPQAMFALFQADRQASAASSGVVRPSQPVEGCMQRPPLPAKHAGQVFLTRPRFTDAFANPSLYQQPWLQETAFSAGADSAPCSHNADVSQAHWGGISSGPPVHSRHATAQGEAASSGHTPHIGTAAVAGSAKHSSIRDTRSQRQGDSTTVPRMSTVRTPAGNATCSQGLDRGRSAERSASMVTGAPEQFEGKDRHDSRGADVGESGRQGSRWSAVNAYRQAREAAVRAAAGNGPAAVRPAAGAAPAGAISRLCSTAEIHISWLSQ